MTSADLGLQFVIQNLQTNKMEENSESSVQVPRDSSADKENVSSFEPPTKKIKLSDGHGDGKVKLEDRLSGILCCAVCLDLPNSCYQVRTARTAVYDVAVTFTIY